MAVKIDITKETPGRVELKLSSCSQALANAIRRTVISDLPAFAITKVDVYENNTVLFNEYLSNRLGLIPLTLDESASDDASISFSLNAESIEENSTVYSRELVSTDPKIKVFQESIPIVKLGNNQRLRLEAVATKGTAKQHARFQSALASIELIDAKKGEFKMFVESFNNIPAKRQLVRALGLLHGDCAKLAKELK